MGCACVRLCVKSVACYHGAFHDANKLFSVKVHGFHTFSHSLNAEQSVF